MHVQGLNHINLKLPRKELEAARDFYVNVLGFEVGARPPFASFGYWLYAGGQPIVHLVEAAEAARGNVAPNPVVDHFALQCADYDATCDRLERAGVGFDARQIPGTGQRQLFLADPTGVGIELLFAAPADTGLPAQH